MTRRRRTNTEVQVVGCEVTLLGFVPSRWQKRRAEDIVDSVSGVTDVHNQLRVSQTAEGSQPSQPSQPDWRNRAA